MQNVMLGAIEKIHSVAATIQTNAERDVSKRPENVIVIAIT